MAPSEPLDSAKLLDLALKITQYALSLADQELVLRDERSAVAPPPPSTESTKGRADLRELCDELLHVVTGPQEHLMAIAQSHRIEAALQYANRFRLAFHVPGTGSISFADLAAKAGLPHQQCAHVLRLLITNYVFTEPEAGFVAHSPESRLMLEDHIDATVDYYTNESFRAASRLADAAERWPASQQRNETGFNLAFDTDLPIFDFFASEPHRAQKFGRAMAGMTQSAHLSLQHLVDGFDWGSLPPGATVVDVGGSAGHCAKALAVAHPSLQFTVQDLKSALGRDDSPRLDPPGRIQYMVHDFYQPQPLQADVFLLRWILHDYSDAIAIRILQAQVSAMRTGQRLLVMDSIMPSANFARRIDERKLRRLDLAMMILVNSYERDINGWNDLYSRVDSRLRLVNVVTPLGSALSVMELQLVDV